MASGKYPKELFVTFDKDGQPDFVTAQPDDAKTHAKREKQQLRRYTLSTVQLLPVGGLK